MKKVITLGEVMMRLSPPAHQRFLQATYLELEFGGSEANVGAALANWGTQALHLSAFPSHELGQAAIASLRRMGINTEFCYSLAGRLGTYFLEKGALHRSSKIIYDREGSSFSKLSIENVDWEKLLEGADWLHWSGISPAISQSAADLTRKAVQEANKRGIKVSGDLNYRSNLWQYGKQVHEIMPEIMENTHLMIAGKRDFEQCLNKSFQDFKEASTFAFQQFKQLKWISHTNRNTYSASHNTISARLFTLSESFRSKSYDLNPIIDRVGTGDAYAAGLIYGLLHLSPQEAIDFAMASGALKHSVPGDQLLCSLEEVQEVMSGKSGKIKR
ncbi:2-dehydro-3-deoxygluconokinase [Algoriphagus faecimaris]|uniref:2-dehydro-3-deoxygluconokinase n=1 Tax=Algoriphagus faecimaris TaxID=686796 RepID=A0A1G6PIY4_9BACT|nr:sugar kinase [Algoriphagus faecimaris]SDC79544.1 2-dehydro-3-deoxygluconokinase [Algoriphagus faecimaris]